MKIYNAYNLIIIGSMIRYLMRVQSNSTVAHIRYAIDGLKINLNEAGFSVTLEFIDEYLKKTLQKITKKKDDDLIGQEICEKLKEEGISLEKTLLAEAKTKTFYSSPNSRYNSQYLLEDPGKLLREDAFQKLTDMAKFDFTSSCRCLLYAEATASAFHILRATEDTLKQYYYKYVKSKRLKLKDQTWGALTYALKAKKIRKPNKTIIDTLDLIRVSYRNPTQHPQKKYDISEAEDLLGLCLDLINKMTHEL